MARNSAVCSSQREVTHCAATVLTTCTLMTPLHVQCSTVLMCYVLQVPGLPQLCVLNEGLKPSSHGASLPLTGC
jgi:hypothetical protein